MTTGLADGGDAFMLALDDMRLRHPTFHSVIAIREDHVLIALIQAFSTGHGAGTGFMHDLAALLDEHGLAAELEPAPDDPEMEFRLWSWYARHGFAWKDDRLMRREPARHIRET